MWGFPDSSVVKNPPVNAGDASLIPDPGRSHVPQSNWARAPQLLSLCWRAWEPQLLSPLTQLLKPESPKARARQQEKPPQWEVRALQRRVAPLTTTEKSLHSNEDPAQPNRNKYFFKLLQIWPIGALLALVPFWNETNFCLTSVLFDTSKCSRIILYFPCFCSGMDHLSKELWFLSLKNGIWALASGGCSLLLGCHGW